MAKTLLLLTACVCVSLQYSLLGLPFSISPLPDPNLKSRPDLHKSFSASQGDAALRSQLQSMQALAAGYQGSLHRLVMLLLKPAVRLPAVHVMPRCQVSRLL